MDGSVYLSKPVKQQGSQPVAAEAQSMEWYADPGSGYLSSDHRLKKGAVIRSFLLFVFVGQKFFCDVDGAVFTLLKGAAHIFSDNTDAE